MRTMFIPCILVLPNFCQYTFIYILSYENYLLTSAIFVKLFVAILVAYSYLNI